MLPYGLWNSAIDDAAQVLQLLDSLLATMAISVTEEVIGPVNHYLADSLNASMVTSIERASLVSLNISAAFQDGMSLLEQGPSTRALADSLNASMAVVTEKQSTVILDISVQLQDGLTLLEQGPSTRSMTDSLSASMATALELQALRVLDISASFQDGMSLVEQGPSTRSLADSLNASMAIVIEGQALRALDISVQLQDGLSLLEQGPQTSSMADSLAAGMAILLEPSIVVVLDISANLQDSLTVLEDDQLPAAPTNLSAFDAPDAGQVDLSWTDNADNEDNYMVERQEYPGPTGWSILTSTLAANTTSYIDTTSVCLVQYNYRVTATNSRANSAPSNIANITPCFL